MATLKQILDAMMAESGFAIPSGYASSLNPADLQLLHLANAASDELRELGLSEARSFHEITLTADTDYPLPADFLSLVPDTSWGGALPVHVPATPEEWAVLRATGLGSALLHARVIGTTLRVLNPAAGSVVRLEYVSAHPWTDGSTTKELATADTDTFRLDRRALIGGVKWRWKKEKGLPDWQADWQAHETYKRTLRGRSHGARALHFGFEADWDGSPQTSVVTG